MTTTHAAPAVTRPVIDTGRRYHPSHSIWRRTIAEEIARLSEVLNEAEAAGPPYADDDYLRQYPGYMSQAREELEQAWGETHPHQREGWNRHWWARTWYYLVCAWTGSETEAAWSALHRADALALMVTPDAVVRMENLDLETTFREAGDVPIGSHQYRTFEALFLRVAATGSEKAVEAHRTTTTAGTGGHASSTTTVVQPARARIELDDRIALRHLREQQHQAWEIARSRARIFRNILTSAIPVLVLVEVLLAALAWRDPTLLSLRLDQEAPQHSDVAMIMVLGAFGGMISAISSMRSLRNFQRSYGLPLAQSVLKIPAGAATAFAGILVLQQGLFGSVQTTSWDSTLPYAVVFGIAQLSITRKIDSRAADLLGDVNAKSPTTVTTTSPAASP